MREPLDLTLLALACSQAGFGEPEREHLFAAAVGRKLSKSLKTREFSVAGVRLKVCGPNGCYQHPPALTNTRLCEESHAMAEGQSTATQPPSNPQRPGKRWAAGKTFVPRRRCLQCGREFYAPPVQVRRGGGKFCGNVCRGAYQREHNTTTPRLNCAVCGAEFRRPAVHLPKGNAAYCSLDCLRKRPTKHQWVPAPPPLKPRKLLPPEAPPRLMIRKLCRECSAPTNGAGKYCGPVCRRVARTGPRAHNWKGGRPVSNCLACGKSYTVAASCKGFVCSIDCWRSIQTKMTKGKPHPTGKGGRRDDLGDLYFRSRWEANWARYLNWLVAQGEIVRWEYEPDTFEFEGIKRGVMHYTPDFKVFERDGSFVYHEVKGWLDQKGRTKLARMARYHPGVTIRLIDKTAYSGVAKVLAKVIPHWERAPGKSWSM